MEVVVVVNRSKMVVLLVRLGVILGMEIKNQKMYIENFGQNLMVMVMVMVMGCCSESRMEVDSDFACRTDSQMCSLILQSPRFHHFPFGFDLGGHLSSPAIHFVQ